MLLEVVPLWLLLFLSACLFIIMVLLSLKLCHWKWYHWLLLFSLLCGHIGNLLSFVVCVQSGRYKFSAPSPSEIAANYCTKRRWDIPNEIEALQRTTIILMGWSRKLLVWFGGLYFIYFHSCQNTVPPKLTLTVLLCTILFILLFDAVTRKKLKEWRMTHCECCMVGICGGRWDCSWFAEIVSEV